MKRIFFVLVIMFLGLACVAEAIDQSLLLKLLELRRESYLTRRGEVSLDLVASYSQDYSLVPWYLTKNMTCNLSANLRLGISNRLEASLRLPFSLLVQDQFVTSWEAYRSSGMGDPTLAVEYEVLQERFNRPATYLTAGFRLPLGKSVYDDLGSNELALGSGHYAAHCGLSFLKSIDPCVVYWGAQYLWTFKRGEYDPEDVLSYNGGLGWSLNQRVNLSLGLSGSISAYHSASLSIGSTFVIDPAFYISPTVIMGLTEEEDDFLFSMGVSLRK